MLASAQLDLRLALEILLREEPGTYVVGTASETAGVRSLLQSSRPDLLILDWDLPGLYAPSHLLAEAKRQRRCPQVIVLGRDRSIEQEALAAGADAFVLLGDPPGDLLVAIRRSFGRHAAASGQMPGATIEEAV